MKKDHVPVQLRLLPDIAAELRNHVRKRGDIAAFVLASLLNTDLDKVPIPELSFGEQKPDTTNYLMHKTLLQRLRATAAARNCSMNALVNAAIAKYSRSLKTKRR